jgi:hypothetical protein
VESEQGRCVALDAAGADRARGGDAELLPRSACKKADGERERERDRISVFVFSSFVSCASSELLSFLLSMFVYFPVFFFQAGPKMKDLAVENRQKYNFDPKILLERVTATYANFSSQEEFAAAVARDARSYNHETFQRAASILRR